MSLKQPNGAAVWTEPLDAGAAVAIAEIHLVDSGSYWVPEAVSVGDVTAARLLDTGTGYFAPHAGDANPSALAELRLIDIGPTIVPYA